MHKSIRDLKVVIGLGKTGLSCVRYFTKQGIDVEVIDSRENPPELTELRQKFPQVKVHLGGFDEVILSQASEFIISPGVALAEPAISACVKRGAKAYGDIEIFARVAKTPLIAITGSNGKSTVTSLVGLMLEKAGIKAGVGGNLGKPALDLLEDAVNYYVLELSSFQLETTHSLKPEVAVVLNISEDHMDRYQNFAEYLAAKRRIYSGCHSAIINRNEPKIYAGLALPKRIISFGIDRPDTGNFGIDGSCLMFGSKRLMALDELRIKGIHNAANALAALAVGSAINLHLMDMLQALYEFPGLSHRSQLVATTDGVSWYNDSKGTNVGATKASVEGLGMSIKGKLVLIAGGLGKGADFSLLNEVVAKYVRTLVLIGKDAGLIEHALARSCRILHATSMADAIMISKKEALPGDAVLLSPACASYDMFNNFEHRGEVFVQEVKKL